jgi:tetratricopeptide (TPR) repeat protein
MKSITIIVLSIMLASSLWAGPKETARENNKIRRGARALIEQGKTDQAIKYLGESYAPSLRRDARAIEVAQCLVGISFDLYNQRKMGMAKEVAYEAIAIVQALRTNAELSPELASVYSAAGLLCELVILDPPQAEMYYSKAVGLAPADQMDKARLGQIRQQQGFSARASRR